MTIASEIAKLQSNLSDSYTACQGKGATMPADENFDNLADCIDSIQTGSTPVISSLNVTPTTSAQTITAPSGTDGYSPVNVSAVTSSIDNNITAENIKNGVSILGVTGSYSGGSKYGLTIDNFIGDTNNGTLVSPPLPLSITFTGVQDINSSALTYRFYRRSNVTDVSFPDLTNISGSGALEYAFSSISSLVNISFPNLTSVTGSNAFYSTFSTTKIASVSFPELLTVTGTQAFYFTFTGNNYLTSLTFPKLTTIGSATATSGYFSNGGQFSSTLSSNTGITTLTFPELASIYCSGTASAYSGTFYNNTKIEKMYFPKLSTITYASGVNTNYQEACKYIFSNCSSLTELHFGAANETAIKSTAGWSTAWGRGAGNVTIYFDL